MSIACVLITHLPIKAELIRHPEFLEMPVIVTQELGAKRLVLDYSRQVRRISVGMPLQEAMSLCQDATLLAADETYYQATFGEILQSLEQRSPLIEASELGCAYVGLDGLGEMYGGSARLITSLLQAVHPALNPRIGVAEGKFPAYIAAITSNSGQATKVPENVAEFLHCFSINLLPISWENKARLANFGLHTLGHITRQPVGAMQAQFGTEGFRAWELAQGIDRRLLVAQKTEEVVTASLAFPTPTVSLSGILIAVESLLAQAFSRKESRGKYARSIALEAQIPYHPPWARQFTYKQAVSGKEKAFVVIKNALESLALPGPLEDLKLTLSGLTGESGIQGSLFSDVRRQEQLRETIRQLQVRWGGKVPIYQARDLEPWSPIPERQKALVQFDP